MLYSTISQCSHNLGIELGRHNRPKPIPIEERTCIHCSPKTLDDEFHFVVKCEKNINERNVLFSKLPPHILNLDCDDLFVYLFSNNNDKHIKAFGKFLLDSFANRQEPDHGLITG